MALESVKRAAASMGSSVQTRAFEATHVEKTESVSGTNGGYVEAASTMAGGLQAGSSGQSGEQMSDQEAERRLKGAVQHANNQIKHSGGKTKCEFAYHEETKRISIKVFNSETKEVIREIPAEETLEMVEKMWELAGILVDEKR